MKIPKIPKIPLTPKKKMQDWCSYVPDFDIGWACKLHDEVYNNGPKYRIDKKIWGDLQLGWRAATNTLSNAAKDRSWLGKIGFRVKYIGVGTVYGLGTMAFGLINWFKASPYLDTDKKET